MRSSYLVIAAVVLVSACARPIENQIEVSSTTVQRWENRDVSELITAIGPFDTTSITGESRAYYWARFGNCQVIARTTREEKIVKVEVRGTTQGCNTYLQKIGDGEVPAAKP